MIVRVLCLPTLAAVVIFGGCAKSSSSADEGTKTDTDGKEKGDEDKTDDEANDDDNDDTDTEGATMSLNLSVVGSLAIGGEAGLRHRKGHFALARDPDNLFYNVSAPASHLRSLKLNIGTITICKEIELNGTAVANTVGCIPLYSGTATEALNSSDVAISLPEGQATTDGYIDIMDAASRDLLNQNVTITEAEVGEYQYGLISWAPPIKVTAELVDPADPESVLLYTKSAEPGQCQVNNNAPYGCARTTSPMTVGPAEEMIFSSNADIVFKFQKPLTITSEDIANKVTYSLKLAFNPDGLIQGVTPNGATNFPPATDATLDDGYNLGNTINLVGAQVAPIFYKASTQVLRETYGAILPLKGFPGATFKLRVELYTLADDPLRAIYGVNTAALSTPETTSYLTGYARIYGLETHEDGSVDLLDYQGRGWVGNLIRITTVGETTTGVLPCGLLHDDADCVDPNALTDSAEFTLEALEEIP